MQASGDIAEYNRETTDHQDAVNQSSVPLIKIAYLRYN